MAPTPCEQCGRLVVDGETVTIPAAEYRALLARPLAEKPEMGKPARSAIAQDRELGDFIIECAKPGAMILKDIRAACIARFGSDRVPSVSAIHRFIQAAARPEPIRPRT